MNFNKYIKPTWKETLKDSGVSNKIDGYIDMAKRLEYPCFVYNRIIYEVTDNGAEATGWFASDLDS
jgi:hypothetical protein